MEKWKSLLTVSYPCVGLGKVMMWQKQSKQENNQYLLYNYKLYKQIGVYIGLLRSDYTDYQRKGSFLSQTSGKIFVCV